MHSPLRRRDLGSGFSEYFELVPALDNQSRDEVFRVRHQVYCQDLAWEAPSADGREQDEFDGQSVHCLLRRRSTNEAVGCIRLVMTRPEDPKAPLPFERSCHDAIDRSVIDPATLHRASVGEVSRLAVLRSFRRRKGEADTALPLSGVDFDERPESDLRFPFIPVGLFLGAAAMAFRLGIEHVFVLTEPRLATHFARIGFDIRPIGRTIEHRGTRVPSLLSSSKVVAGLRPLIRPMYDVIDAAVASAFAAHTQALGDRARG